MNQCCTAQGPALLASALGNVAAVAKVLGKCRQERVGVAVEVLLVQESIITCNGGFSELRLVLGLGLLCGGMPHSFHHCLQYTQIQTYASTCTWIFVGGD